MNFPTSSKSHHLKDYHLTFHSLIANFVQFKRSTASKTSLQALFLKPSFIDTYATSNTFKNIIKLKVERNPNTQTHNPIHRTAIPRQSKIEPQLEETSRLRGSPRRACLLTLPTPTYWTRARPFHDIRVWGGRFNNFKKMT